MISHGFDWLILGTLCASLGVNILLLFTLDMMRDQLTYMFRVTKAIMLGKKEY